MLATSPVGTADATSVDATHLQSLVARHTRDEVIVSDAAGRILWVNDAFERGTGYRLDEVSGRFHDHLLLGPETAPRARHLLRESLSASQAARTEILLYSRSGHSRWVEIEQTPVFDGDGNVTHFAMIQRDVSQRKTLECAHRESVAVQQALDREAIVSTTDARGIITYVNDKFCAVSGYRADELIGRTHSIVSSGHHSTEFFASLWDTISQGKAWHGEICNEHKQGGRYWVDTTIVPVRNDHGDIDSYMSVRFEITEQKTAVQELERLAAQDELTGLANRRTLMANLDTLLTHHGRRDRDRCGILILIDMDYFKSLNDTRGHDFGDVVLQTVGERLHRSTRDATTARLGGDEFAVLMSGLPSDPHTFDSIVSRIYGELSQPIVSGGISITPSFSMGVTCFPGDGIDGQTLLKNADIAMYEAKRLGRGRWHFFSPTLQASVEATYEMEDKLRRALAEDAFSVAMQPQIDLTTGEVRGVEALIRWRHEDTWIPPMQFIPAAEQSGLILMIGDTVLGKALLLYKRLLDDGLDPGILAVNVSARQLQQEHFADSVQAFLERYGVAPERLELELTETAFFGTHSVAVRSNVAALRELGVSLALDDFGTGFSSLMLLKQLRVDAIKIDRSFVKELGKSSDDEEIVRAIIALGRNLRLRLVGEGIEDSSLAEYLHAAGCHYGQGFHYAKPMFEEDLRAFLGSAEPHDALTASATT